MDMIWYLLSCASLLGVGNANWSVLPVCDRLTDAADSRIQCYVSNDDVIRCRWSSQNHHQMQLLYSSNLDDTPDDLCEPLHFEKSVHLPWPSKTPNLTVTHNKWARASRNVAPITYTTPAPDDGADGISDDVAPTYCELEQITAPRTIRFRLVGDSDDIQTVHECLFYSVKNMQVGSVGKVNLSVSKTRIIYAFWSKPTRVMDLMYVVECYEQHGDESSTLVDRNYVIGEIYKLYSITPYTTYRVTIRAAPHYGGYWSTESDAIIQSLEDVPSAAPAVRRNGYTITDIYTDKGENIIHVTVFWEPIGNVHVQNGPITEYQLYIQPLSGSGSSNKTVHGAATNTDLYVSESTTVYVNAATSMGYNHSLGLDPIVIAADELHLFTSSIVYTVAIETELIVLWDLLGNDPLLNMCRSREDFVTGCDDNPVRRLLNSSDMQVNLYWCSSRDCSPLLYQRKLQSVTWDEESQHVSGVMSNSSELMSSMSSAYKIGVGYDSSEVTSGILWSDCLQVLQDDNTIRNATTTLTVIDGGATALLEWKQLTCQQRATLIGYSINICEMDNCNNTTQVTRVPANRIDHECSNMKVNTNYSIWLEAVHLTGTDSSGVVTVLEGIGARHRFHIPVTKTKALSQTIIIVIIVSIIVFVVIITVIIYILYKKIKSSYKEVPISVPKHPETECMNLSHN